MHSARQRIRAVIDTNLIISGLISQGGTPHQLIALWRQGRFTLLVTPEIQAEYERVLARPVFAKRYGLSQEELSAFLRRLHAGALQSQPSTTLPGTVRDAKDTMVLAAALGGHATHLVTGDQDLLVLRDAPQIGRLHIVTASEFLEVLEAAY